MAGTTNIKNLIKKNKKLKYSQEKFCDRFLKK